MIALDLPVPLLWALRWLLFLGPLVAATYLCFRVRHDAQTLVGCLFAFLYGLGLIFASHTLAIAAGWWHYGGDVLMLNGIPADIWIGGAILFGPVLYLAFPSIAPLWLTLPIVVLLHGILFSSLRPLVYAGHDWFVGVILVFATAHIPAIYLARWTSKDHNLAYRVTLLAIGYGFLAFMVLPALIIHAMGETIAPLSQPIPLLVACAIPIGVLFVIGFSAVQMFAVHGQGTPIPLDPTKRLVRTGVFAYVANPMQLVSAATWVFMGIALGSVWVAASAIMAWVFVMGMVRWHHRHDLLKRFPEGWPEYRAHVPEWIPRWRPWMPYTSNLTFDPNNAKHRRLIQWLQSRPCVGIAFTPSANSPLSYTDGSDSMTFKGSAATAKALNHCNFACAILSAALLLMALPYQHAASRFKRGTSSTRLETDTAA